MDVTGKNKSIVEKRLGFFEQLSSIDSTKSEKPLSNGPEVTAVAVSSLPPYPESVSSGSDTDDSSSGQPEINSVTGSGRCESPRSEKKRRSRLGSLGKIMSRVFSPRPPKVRRGSDGEELQITRNGGPSPSVGKARLVSGDDFEENWRKEADFFSTIRKMTQAYSLCQARLLADMVSRKRPQLHHFKVKRIGVGHDVKGAEEVIEKLARELLNELFREALRLSQYVKKVELLGQHKILSENLNSKVFLTEYADMMSHYHLLLREVCFASRQFSLFFDFGKVSNEDSKVTWDEDVTVTKNGESVRQKQSVTFDFFTETAALFQRFPKQKDTFERLSKKVAKKNPEAEACFKKILIDHREQAIAYKHRERMLEMATSLAALHKRSAIQPFIDRLGRL